VPRAVIALSLLSGQQGQTGRSQKHGRILPAADAGCGDEEVARVAVGGSAVHRTEAAKIGDPAWI